MDRNRFFDEEAHERTGEVRYTFKFGKYKDEYLDDVVTEFTGRKYLEWMCEKIEDIPDEIKTLIEEHIESYERENDRRR